MKTKVTYKTTKASKPHELKEAALAYNVQPVACVAMVRTQIYLTKSEHDFLQVESSRRGEPMAAVIRSFIDQKMEVPEDAWTNNPLLDPPADPSYIGPEDGVINHDHYIYGAPKKWIKQNGQWVETPPLPDDYYSNRASSDAYDAMLQKMELEEKARG